MSLRAVDNARHGYGLTYNAVERVQAFTNPRWTRLLVPIAGETGECLFSTLTASFVVSALAVGFGLRCFTTNALGATLGLLACCLSKAFIDFSTSGLENPLAHALLARFFWLYVARRASPRGLIALGAVASLVVVNRMDHAFIVGPALAHAAFARRSWRRFGRFCLGALPFVAWELFSLVYYGVEKVVRAPLFDAERWPTIVAMNLGMYDPLAAPDCAAGR